MVTQDGIHNPVNSSVRVQNGQHAGEPVRHNRTLGTLFNTMANTCQTQQDIGNSVQHNGKHLSDTTGHWELCLTQWQKPVRHNRTLGTLFNTMAKTCQTQQDTGNSVQHNGKNLSDHNRTLGTLFNTTAKTCQTQQDIGNSVQHNGKIMSDTTGHWELYSTQWQEGIQKSVQHSKTLVNMCNTTRH